MELNELVSVLKSASGDDRFDFCEVLKKISGDSGCHGFEWCNDCKKFIMDSIASELEKSKARLMPEGMEWPRFEDGEPVEFGGKGLDIRGAVRSVKGVKFTQGGFVFISDDMGRVWWANDKGPTEDPCVDPSKRVKRPAPKVLDADGVEIELGDDLYSVEGGLKFHVSHIDRINGKIATDAMFSLDKWADPAMYTHRAPVLAADGKPLREGETVWLTTGYEAPYRVEEVRDGFLMVSAENFNGERDYATSFSPRNFTHERPDSLDRLAEDIGAMVVAWRANKHLFDAQEAAAGCVGENTMGAALDSLVRRAKALAERDA